MGNPYQFKVTCDICGGEGVGTHKTAAAAWFVNNTITHKDPEVCRSNIAARKCKEQMVKDVPWIAGLV